MAALFFSTSFKHSVQTLQVCHFHDPCLHQALRPHKSGLEGREEVVLGDVGDIHLDKVRDLSTVRNLKSYKQGNIKRLNQIRRI